MPATKIQLPNIDSAWFKNKLTEKNLSIRGVARLMGLNPSTVSLMIAGKRGMPHQDAQKLADLLGVSLVEIYRRAGKPLSEPKTTARLDLADDIVLMTKNLLVDLEAQGSNLARSINVRNLVRAIVDFEEGK